MQSKKLQIDCTNEFTETEKAGSGVTIFRKQEVVDDETVPSFVDKNPSTISNFHIFKPLHVRIREYYEARNRIFNEEPKVKPSRSANRMSTFWKKVRSFKKEKDRIC